ncbi:DASH family cryptochrome [Olivibacter sitiensis]|uniref:DASH family cryptochrome n=1 Tax=Olivibacter sitiensis TaxID=376470 RepID=UPI0004187B60|nr:DASH family cryptochrome [Olivibacter sitiensis]
MVKDTLLVWFRNDLRVQDNEILLTAIERADLVLPVYIFDPRYFSEDETSKIKRTGVFRANFLLESVHDLRLSLRELGGDLLVRVGYPEEIIPQLASEYQVKEVYHHREVAEEETHISGLVEAALWKLKLNLRHIIGHTLYHKEDLPFPIKDIPSEFSVFKKKIERESSIRGVSEGPSSIAVPVLQDEGEVPSLAELGYDDEDIKLSSASVFHGGESQAWIVIRDLLSVSIQEAKDGHSLLSPWIQMGCISVHSIYKFINEHKDQLPYRIYDSLLIGLLWRDYYRFMFKKYQSIFFQPNGFSDEELTYDLSFENASFKNWCEGETGHVLVDEIMQSLNRTGFISHEARLLAAHYLIHDLRVSHLLGARYFEYALVDYCPASGYGNWAHVAGVGTSKKENAPKNFDKLCKDYLQKKKQTCKSVMEIARK